MVLKADVKMGGTTLGKIKGSNQNKCEVIDESQITVASVASKLISIAALIEGQSSAADGMVELFGLGQLLREWAEALDQVSKDLDDINISKTK